MKMQTFPHMRVIVLLEECKELDIHWFGSHIAIAACSTTMAVIFDYRNIKHASAGRTLSNT